MPGGISISLGRLHLSAMPRDGMRGHETNPRQIDSHPCNLDPRACRESVSRMGSCARSSRIDPVVLFSGQSRLEEWWFRFPYSHDDGTDENEGRMSAIRRG